MLNAAGVRALLEEKERQIIGIKKDCRRRFGNDEASWPPALRARLEDARAAAKEYRRSLAPEKGRVE